MALEAGSRLGPYEIVGLLGSGGMGEIYRARDPRLEREVAIKVLREEIADPKRLRRFEQEARTAGALNHPNVLAVYDVGTHRGVPYVVSELLEGRTLRFRLEGGALPLRKALDHALEIAHGLAAAHDGGIVHRDLKPDNLFITGDGRVKILDFGLAKLTRPRLPVQQGDQGTATQATESGVVLGTVGFMSPEQVRGEEVDPRSDIFSFGAVLYEMLSGVRAFRRDSAVETMNAILKEDPPELSETGRGIPPGLVRIVRRCLEKRAADRFRSAHDLALGLEAVSSGVSGPSHQEEESRSGVTRAGGLIWRHKRRLVLALAATALVAAGVYRVVVRSPASVAGTHGIDSLAVLPFENVGAEPGSQYLSDGVAESLIDELSRVPKLRVIARSTSFRFRGNDVDPRQVGRDLGVGAVLTGRVSVRGDTLVIGAELVDVAKGTQLWGERYNTKLGDIFVVQENIASQISRGLRLKLAPQDQGLLTRRQTGSPEAYRLQLLSRYELTVGAAEGFKKAIQYAQQAIEKDPGYAAAYEALALALAGYTKMGQLPYREGYSRSRTAATKALELDERLPEAHLVLSGDVLSLDWDWAGAEREIKRALELNPNLAEAQSKYGLYLVQIGRSKEGIEYLERALALDPASLVCRVGILYGYYLARQYDQALARAKEMPELNSFAWAHGFLALVYREKGMYEEAIAEDRKDSPRCGGTRGNTFARAGKVSEARGCLREIRERFEKQGVGAYEMALVYAGLGGKDQAFEWLERAYEVHDQGITALKVDPPLDPLRSDPRFQDLMRRANFPS